MGRLDGVGARADERGPRAGVRHRARRLGEGGRIDPLPLDPAGAREHRDRLDLAHPVRLVDGANAEAKLLQLEYAFETLGCHRVEFKTDALNERARPALAALPARFEGIHRKHMLVRDGVSRDSAWYSVLDDEWPAVRDALRERLASAS